MLTDSVRHLAFKRDDGQAFNYQAGQFINFHFERGGKPIMRSYSVGSMNNDKSEIEIAVSYVEGGLATGIFSSVQDGDILTASGPYGRLLLRDEMDKRLILIATGTGITPYRAMLRDFHQYREVIVIAGSRYRPDALYADDFLTYANANKNFQYFACFSREGESQLSQHEYKGYVQNKLQDLKPNPDNDIVYLCGNPNMIDDTFNALKEQGFLPANVRREKYISNG